MTENLLKKLENRKSNMDQSFVTHDDELQGAANLAGLPSYLPTRWPFVNRILDIVDRLSAGRAGWVQRFFSFAFFGGFAALVNLAVFYTMYYVVPIPVNPFVHNIIAYVCACELSLLANFIPNDYFTFSHLAKEGGRSWSARCIRYHVTSIIGSLLTLLIQFAFTFFLHTTPILGQAVALILVLFYNFSFHHLYTYRHKKVVTVEEAIVGAVTEAVSEAVTGETPVIENLS